MYVHCTPTIYVISIVQVQSCSVYQNVCIVDSYFGSHMFGVTER